MSSKFLSQEAVDALLNGVTEEPTSCHECGRIVRADALIPNFDPLRKAYEASRARHPAMWKPGSGMIDEVDGKFLALAFNAMHLLVSGLTPPKRAKKVMQNFHEDSMNDVQFFVPEMSE